MTSTTAARGVGAAIAVALALAGCTSPVGGPGADGARGPAPAGPSPLDFTAITLDGATFEGDRAVGQAVVLWFWAPWCTLCRAEGPDVAEVAAELDGSVRFLGVGGRGTQTDLQDFVDTTGTGAIEHLADADGSLWRRFGVVAQPTFVFVAPSGAATSFAGSLGGTELRERAADLAEG